jgi:hypothetical protein
MSEGWRMQKCSLCIVEMLFQLLAFNAILIVCLEKQPDKHYGRLLS